MGGGRNTDDTDNSPKNIEKAGVGSIIKVNFWRYGIVFARKSEKKRLILQGDICAKT